MAHHDVIVSLLGSSALPRDQFINTLHFEVNAPDSVEGLADGITDAYLELVPQLGGIRLLTVKVYAEGLNPAGPEHVKETDLLSIVSDTGGPSELACCLSYAAVDDPEASTARRRGRIYVGPWRRAACQQPRPIQSDQDHVLDLGEALASVGTASNTTWLMRSVRDDTYAKIESIWTDDAWDIQRRRGIAPTARTIRDVQ